MRKRSLSDLIEGAPAPFFIDLLEGEIKLNLLTQLVPLILTEKAIVIFCTNMHMVQITGAEIAASKEAGLITTRTLRHIQFTNGCQIYLATIDKADVYIRSLRFNVALAPIEEKGSALTHLIGMINPGGKTLYYKDIII